MRLFVVKFSLCILIHLLLKSFQTTLHGLPTGKNTIVAPSSLRSVPEDFLVPSCPSIVHKVHVTVLGEHI